VKPASCGRATLSAGGSWGQSAASRDLRRLSYSVEDAADAFSRVGGVAHVAGKSAARQSAEREQQENEQDKRLDNLEQQAPPTPDPPAQDAPAATPSIRSAQPQFAALHEQGALTDDEFATAKARLLGG
jgi:hypothetical protein